MTTEPILSVRHIYKTYYNGARSLEVLRDINLELRQAEIVALQGPSGIGKSTLLNIIGTLDHPDRGEILIHNRNPFEMHDQELSRFRARHIGFVFQFHHLLPEFTALENVMLPGRILGTDLTELETRARELLAEVGLEGRLEHRPAQLSGGERQRVAVARALINRPTLVLADEPTGNLDPANGERLLELIFKLREHYRQAFLIATHNPHLAAGADRVIRL